MSFSYSDFASTVGLTLVGDAASASSRLRLTPSASGKVGGAWRTTKETVYPSFATEFHFSIHDLVSGGADGFAFGIQNTSVTALQGGGSSMGYSGLANSLFVEFDTFNGGSGDVDSNHVAIHSCGTSANSWTSSCRLATTSAGALGVNLKDGSTHVARISYDGTALRVYLDDLATPKLTYSSLNLSTFMSLTGGTQAWVGFVAATGGFYEAHDVHDWDFGEAATTARGLYLPPWELS